MTNKERTFKKKWTAWKFIAKESRRFYSDDHIPSLTIALRDLLRFYWQIETNANADPLLCDELSELFDMLLENTLCSMGVESEKVKKHFTDENFNLEKNDHAENLYEIDSFELAVHLYSELLQNRVQATHKVLEAPIYNFKFINASTKIYKAYYNIVECIEKCLNDNFPKKSEPKQKLNFFITMHHADIIKAQLLFPDDSAFNRIIAIRIDKKSFFSPRNSLPRILHEMGHFVNPYAPEKNRSLLNTVCFDIARQLFYAVVIELDNQYLYAKINNCWNTDCIEVVQEIQTKIKELVEKCLKDEGISYNLEFNLFCKRLNMVIRSIFSIIDKKVEKEATTFSDQINKFCEKEAPNGILLDYVSNWIIQSISNGAEIGMPLKFWQVEANQLKTEQNKDDINNINETLDRLLTSYRERKETLRKNANFLSMKILKSVTAKKSLLNVLQERAESPEEKKHLADYLFDKRLNEYTRPNQSFLRDQVLENISQIDINKVIERYKYLYDETISDIFMIAVLGLDCEDYKSIFESKPNEKNSLFDKDETINGTRQTIILRHHFNENIPKKMDSEIDGFYDLELADYLSKFEEQFVEPFLSVLYQQDMKDELNLQKQYDRVNEEENISTELDFFRVYWEMGKRDDHKATGR